MRFEAKMDDLAKILTFVVIGILVIPTVLIINVALHGTPAVLIPLVVVLVSLVVVAFFRVDHYELSDGQLQVVRPAGTKSIPLQDLKSATPVTTKDLGFGIRLFGSGGWFGYFGFFYYRILGPATLYATDRSKLILLKTTTGKNVIVSPVDGPAFLQTLRLPTDAV